MMPLPPRPSNQKSGVCPWKAETFSQDKAAASVEFGSSAPGMQAPAPQRSIQISMNGISKRSASLIICAAATAILFGPTSLRGQEPTENCL